MHLQSILAALFLFAAAPLQPSIDAAPGSRQGSLNGWPHGHAHGSFELPSSAGPGAMHGRLFSPSGVALFRVDAHVTLGNAGPYDGRIDGVLVRLVGPHPGPVAEVHGPWDIGTSLPGQFRLHVIVPGDPSQGIPPDLIGRIEGRFIEPNGPLPPAGEFKARWELHP